MSLTVAISTAAGLLTAGGNAQAATTAQWHDLVDQAAAEVASSINVLDRAGRGNEILARDLWAITEHSAWRWGWADNRTKAWLNRMYSLRKPDGGWGLATPWDWNNDGSTNPASTSYTITTAYHVGRTLIKGYEAGVVPPGYLTSAARSILNTPTTAWNSSCVSYSNNPPDARVACVWNINSSAAWFLWKVSTLKLIPPGRETEATNKIRAWRNLTRANFKSDLRGWTYQHNTPGPQDAFHNMATVEPIAQADPTFRETAVSGQLAKYGSVINATLVRPGLNGITCAQAEAYFADLYNRAHAPYGSQYERVTSRNLVLGIAMDPVRTCHNA